MPDGLIVDSFAGGGGASLGIERALGRPVDIAINHDPDAMAMHEANHPATLHLSKNIWKVDPIEAVRGNRVALAWFSPDCKHFSKAKGGRPVKRNIRDLAWVVVLWAKRARPAVICLENVEEFRDWGPLVEKEPGRYVPCPERRGETFRRWIGELKRLGYKVEARELRACDYGAPTIRKRLFLVARCDGLPIVWPEPTHGPPDDPDVIAGRKMPWRTAAEIIDWSLPCPSIFDTAEEIKAKFGIRAVRPLADATMRRIARGVVRYVLEDKQPFIVVCNHGGDWFRGQGIGEPMQTLTAARDAFGVVVPSFVGCGGRAGQSAPRGGGEPLGTQTAKADACLVASTLIQTGYGERDGQAPRVPGLGKPTGTQVAGGSKHALVAAFLAQHNTGMTGHRADKPLSTMVQKGCTQGLVAVNLMHQFTSNTNGGKGDLRQPLKTVLAEGQHAALIASFLTKYYGTGGQWARADDPCHTLSTRDRMGLVTVEIDGETFVIADIGMRMLSPRERFRAQGFPDTYEIETRPDGARFTRTVQGRCCGNSVCPPVAEALVRANFATAAPAREGVAA